MKKHFDKVAGVVLILLFFLFAFLGVQEAKGQNYSRVGKIFIEQKKDSSTRSGAKKTDMVFIDNRGHKDTIYVSSKGAYFIFKVSKKTGKPYRRYLKEVTKELNPDYYKDDKSK